MGIYFGTDGLRGVYGKEITPKIAYKVGNSLARLCKRNEKVILGRDTRTSGSTLALAFSSGLTSGGVSVVDVGIVTTPAVAFLTTHLDFDYGVMISASHNPKSHNGIKIFDSNGYKISPQEEFEVEKNMIYAKENNYMYLGKYDYKPNLKQHYINNITTQFKSLNSLKIALDCANGASYLMAKNMFEKCGAKVLAFNCGSNGKKINVDCGALHHEIISKLTTKYNCDMGFSFDGDADRVIACDENGKILDGDDILYLLAEKYSATKIVGTSMTNQGLELALKNKGITLTRADVGDKYVSLMMRELNAFIGGEPCGHIINSKFSKTGDGVLTALSIASLAKENKKALSTLCNYSKFPQVIVNVNVTDKQKILNSSLLKEEIDKCQKLINNEGRILVRASGTESKIRIMCEDKNLDSAKLIAKRIEKCILSIN